MSYTNIGIVIVISFIIAALLTKAEIPILRAKAGQNIREVGPESHLSKAGTPSMGGIAIILAATVASLTAGVIWASRLQDMLLILFVFIAFGLIGFFDDYLKVDRKSVV